MGMAEALKGVKLFDTEGILREACPPAGLFQSKLLSSPGGASQVKCSYPELILVLVAAQPSYICFAEEGVS